MNRVMRMGIGLVALVPVMALAGALLLAAGVVGETAAWMVLGVAVIWIALMIWWALRAPPQIASGDRSRYSAFLRHAQYQQLDPSDRDGGAHRT